MTDDDGTGRLGDPRLAGVLDELVRRFGEGRDPVSISLTRLDDAALVALADLLGTERIPRRRGRIPAERLAWAVGVEDVAGLRRAVEALRGPLPDRAAQRRAERDARADLWDWFRAAVDGLGSTLGPPPTAGPAPDDRGLSGWAEAVRAAGATGGVATHRRRLEQVVAVLGALPAEGASLATLAADVLGDPHALDRGSAVGRLVVDAVSAWSGREPARDAEATRQRWESVGVAPDPLSSTVLVLGLRPDGDDPLARWLQASADANEPCVVTLAQLRRWPPAPLPDTAPAFVVENPSILAEAARRLDEPPVVVCSSGRPTVAVLTLLRRLGAAGAPLLQHADFDAGGLAITTWLAEQAGTTPWHMAAADYRAATAGAGPGVPLPDRLPPTPWDPSLRPAMAERGVVAYEEAVRGDLLAAFPNVRCSDVCETSE